MAPEHTIIQAQKCMASQGVLKCTYSVFLAETTLTCPNEILRKALGVKTAIYARVAGQSIRFVTIRFKLVQKYIQILEPST